MLQLLPFVSSILHSPTKLRAINPSPRPSQTSDLPTDRHEEFIDSTFSVFIQHRNSVLENIYDGVLDLVKRLRQRGIVVAALTNGNAELHNIGSLLSDELFNIHINPSMVGAAKPDPHMFKRLLELTGVQAHEVSEARWSQVLRCCCWNVYCAMNSRIRYSINLDISFSRWGDNAKKYLSKTDNKGSFKDVVSAPSRRGQGET
jgi:hypothetical protein